MTVKCGTFNSPRQIFGRVPYFYDGNALFLTHTTID
jgi:hypothetical protein